MTKRTKIVCTLGPATDDDAIIRGMLRAGMDVARFNCSHGSHAEHAERLERLRRVRDELDSPCALLLDTRGRAAPLQKTSDTFAGFANHPGSAGGSVNRSYEKF